MAWSNIDDLTSKFLQMENKSFLEVALEKDNLIVSFSIFIVFFISSLYTVLGVGMNMSAVEMTRMTVYFLLQKIYLLRRWIRIQVTWRCLVKK